MALSMNSLDNGSRSEFISADELDRAVVGQLLSQEEARTIYWSQFDILRRAAVDKAVTTPPPLAAAA